MATASELVREYVDELAALLASGDVDLDAPHPSHLHESEAARRDTAGAMFWCPPCRVNVLTKTLREMAEAAYDDKPNPRFEGKSRREAVLERLTERREKETDQR